ncbi:6-phosphogluconolactonase [Patagioenas fasciata monilis]|uniref:6-phosphogluconolactonase n=1 Tax=Patagioenas fasciata monilis TaxID=372326 RepID=A0A1V4KXR9_PATFA|nr:6-phosphogluconolactonase [Patagioenas fasciata monilis]
MAGSVSVFPSPEELSRALAALVAERAAAVAEAGGRFSVALSGGSLVGLLSRDLPAAVSATGPAAPERWLVAFCDERLVPPEHPESTWGAYQAQLLPRLPGPGPRVLSVTPGLGPEAAADDYAEQLRKGKGFKRMRKMAQGDPEWVGMGHGDTVTQNCPPGDKRLSPMSPER